MKVIALLPFKNEEWCLPAYLHNTKVIADEIIAIDDGSTDNSVKILEDAGAKVYSSEKLRNFNSGWSEGSIRAELLKLGREAGGVVAQAAAETHETQRDTHTAFQKLAHSGHGFTAGRCCSSAFLLFLPIRSVGR